MAESKATDGSGDMELQARRCRATERHANRSCTDDDDGAYRCTRCLTNKLPAPVSEDGWKSVCQELLAWGTTLVRRRRHVEGQGTTYGALASAALEVHEFRKAATAALLKSREQQDHDASTDDEDDAQQEVDAALHHRVRRKLQRLMGRMGFSWTNLLPEHIDTVRKHSPTMVAFCSFLFSFFTSPRDNRILVFQDESFVYEGEVARLSLVEPGCDNAMIQDVTATTCGVDVEHAATKFHQQQRLPTPSPRATTEPPPRRGAAPGGAARNDYPTEVSATMTRGGSAGLTPQGKRPTDFTATSAQDAKRRKQNEQPLPKQTPRQDHYFAKQRAGASGAAGAADATSTADAAAGQAKKAAAETEEYEKKLSRTVGWLNKWQDYRICWQSARLYLLSLAPGKGFRLLKLVSRKEADGRQLVRDLPPTGA